MGINGYLMKEQFVPEGWKGGTNQSKYKLSKGCVENNSPDRPFLRLQAEMAVIYEVQEIMFKGIISFIRLCPAGRVV
jgi:hypothetical protein